MSRHHRIGTIRRVLLGWRFTHELDRLVEQALASGGYSHMMPGTRELQGITRQPELMVNLATELLGLDFIAALFNSSEFRRLSIRTDARGKWVVASVRRVHRVAISQGIESLVPA
jgi:hypothetical protein